MNKDKRQFPIVQLRENPSDEPEWIPWALLQDHEMQARKNHSQSLYTLASGGGITVREAYFLIRDMDLNMAMPSLDECIAFVRQAIADYEAQP
ncbi:MAG: hypothetical protein C4534_06525 [Gaiellales bacterium]|nr:MAG: hypothetical protein C4534_06525 [Gaiellales bacterium]